MKGTFELDLLLVFELPHALEGQVHIIQGENVKFRGQLPREEMVVQKHLSHFVAWHRDIDGGLQPRQPYS